MIRLAHRFAAASLTAAALLQVAVVALRAGGIGMVWGQELVTALAALTILLGSGPALFGDRLVRIDALSQRFGAVAKRCVERLGFVFLLVPMAAAILWFSVPYAVESIRFAEGSTELSGLPAKYALKAMVPVFAALMLWAGWRRWRMG